MHRVLEMLILSKTEGMDSLGEVLVKNAGQFDKSASLLIITSSTRTEWVLILRKLRRRGLNIAVVLVDAASFGGEQSLDDVAAGLVSGGIPTYVVHRGDSFAHALSRPIALDNLPIFTGYSNPEQILVSEIL